MGGASACCFFVIHLRTQCSCSARDGYSLLFPLMGLRRGRIGRIGYHDLLPQATLRLARALCVPSEPSSSSICSRGIQPQSGAGVWASMARQACRPRTAFESQVTAVALLVQASPEGLPVLSFCWWRAQQCPIRVTKLISLGLAKGGRRLPPSQPEPADCWSWVLFIMMRTTSE